VTVPFANFDDSFADHPKVARLSDGAYRLHSSGILYCNRYLTDGRISVNQASRLIPKYRASYLLELVAGGLWHHIGNDEYSIHDFLDWNRSREQVESDRERKRKAGKKGAESRWH
jgi:hypothetical protein